MAEYESWRFWKENEYFRRIWEKMEGEKAEKGKPASFVLQKLEGEPPNAPKGGRPASSRAIPDQQVG